MYRAGSTNVSVDRAIYSLMGPFLELCGGPLTEALGRLPTLLKAKAGTVLDYPLNTVATSDYQTVYHMQYAIH